MHCNDSTHQRWSLWSWCRLVSYSLLQLSEDWRCNEGDWSVSTSDMTSSQRWWWVVRLSRKRIRTSSGTRSCQITNPSRVSVWTRGRSTSFKPIGVSEQTLSRVEPTTARLHQWVWVYNANLQLWDLWQWGQEARGEPIPDEHMEQWLYMGHTS